jgi:hypothetical protein
MSPIRVSATIEQDGELHLQNLPLRRGQRVDLIVVPTGEDERPLLTAADLLASDLPGLWAERADLADSPAAARALRAQAERRSS